MVDANKEKCNERHTSRSRCEITESQGLHPAREIVTYHKVKRRFLNLKDMVKEDPDQLVMCEFRGQDFDLVAD